MNTVLEQCKERVYSKDTSVTEVDLGLYVIRGELISIIGKKITKEQTFCHF